MKSHAKINVTTPTGKLIVKIDCHENASTSQPPNSGPEAVERPIIELKMPKAIPRSLPSKLVPIKANDSDMSADPPIAWIARKICNMPMVVDAASSPEPIVKITSPIININLRPYKSPSFAQINNKTEKTIV